MARTVRTWRGRARQKGAKQRGAERRRHHIRHKKSGRAHAQPAFGKCTRLRGPIMAHRRQSLPYRIYCRSVSGEDASLSRRKDTLGPASTSAIGWARCTPRRPKAPLALRMPRGRNLGEGVGSGSDRGQLEALNQGPQTSPHRADRPPEKPLKPPVEAAAGPRGPPRHGPVGKRF